MSAKPILTTITPFWGREEMLKGWIKAIRGASIPQVQHLVYFVREYPPSWWIMETMDMPVITNIRLDDVPGTSIGFYHNLGAKNMDTEWIMKIDVDAVPNVLFFHELMPILKSAGEREWFNAGMFYIARKMTQDFLSDDRLPLQEDAHRNLIHNLKCNGLRTYKWPEATNFICRREDYLKLGGCDPKFRGWGWEDYQQIFMLENYQQGKDPLPGEIDLNSASRRCRDEISRPKALELYNRNSLLALMHRYHETSTDVVYRSGVTTEKNRRVLLDSILRIKNEAKNLQSV